MKTTTKISAAAYDVELIDLRTHTHQMDRIVLEQSCIREMAKMDISDYEFLSMAYGKRGFMVHKMHTRRKISLIVDLEQLYADQTKEGVSYD